MNDIIINFDLTVDETNVILSGLGKLPAELSFGIISKIKTIADQQVRSAQQAQAEKQEE